jgi:hypothetical protein
MYSVPIVHRLRFDNELLNEYIVAPFNARRAVDAVHHRRGDPGGRLALGHEMLTTGTITGVVLDSQGLRTPGVTVEIRNEQTNDVRTTVSNEVGLFTMPALPLGKYTLKLALDGFATVERVGIQLRSGEVYNAGTITLGVGALTQATTVYAESAVVQTANAEKNAVLEERAIESLVARGRDPLNLLRTMPGVQADVNTASLGATNGAPVPNIGGLLRSTVMGEACLRVGYVSASQFSREYARFFGNAPTKDVAQLRERGFAPTEDAR